MGPVGEWVATGQCLSDIPDFWMSCGYVFQLQCASKTSYPVRGAIFWAPNPANTCSLPSTCNDVGDFLCCPEESWEPCLLYDWTAVGVVFLVILLLLMLLGGNRSVFWFLIYPFLFFSSLHLSHGIFFVTNEWLFVLFLNGDLWVQQKKNIRKFLFLQTHLFEDAFWSNSSSWGVVAWLVVIVTSVVAFLSLVQSVGSSQTWHHHNRNWLVLWWVKEKEQTLSEAKKSPSFPKKRFGKVRLGTHQTGTCFYPDLLPRNLTQLLKKWWLEDVKFQGCKWSLESWIQVHLLSCFPTSIFLLVNPCFRRHFVYIALELWWRFPPQKKTGGFENCCATKVSVGWINLIQSHRNLLHRKGFQKKGEAPYDSHETNLGWFMNFQNDYSPGHPVPPKLRWKVKVFGPTKTIPPKTPFTNSANICLDVDGLWLLCR